MWRILDFEMGDFECSPNIFQILCFKQFVFDGKIPFRLHYGKHSPEGSVLFTLDNVDVGSVTLNIAIDQQRWEAGDPTTCGAIKCIGMYR